MDMKLSAPAAAILRGYQDAGSPSRVLLGVSGGADSVALLYAFSEARQILSLECQAVHIHHGLRTESNGDAVFVKELCEKLQIPLSIRKISVSRNGSVEANARTARYAAFHEVMRETGIATLALAHHMDDQAETLLLHLLYGAGSAGLGGMHPFARGIWRPFLSFRRQELREYLCGIGSSWREDESNGDDRYTRNAIRHRLIPVMENLSPSAVPSAARSAELLRDEDAFIDSLAERWLAENARLGPPRFLLIKPLLSLHPAFVRRILRLFCREAGVQLDFTQTERLRACTANNGAPETNLPGGWRALRTEKRLHLLDGREDISCDSGCRIAFEPFREAFGDGRRTQAIDSSVLSGAVLRTRRTGDRIRPFGSSGSQSLKEYMINKKLDRPFRDRWPLLCRGCDVIWIPGFGISQEAAIGKDTSDARLAVLSGTLPDEIEEEGSAI